MDENKRQILSLVYGMHKREIATRRALEYVTGVTGLLFYGFIFVLIWLKRGPDGLNLSMGEKAIATIALVIVGDLIVYFLIKNYRRQCELKRAVAKIDDAFGLFTDGAYVPGASIYPKEWKNFGEERILSNISRLCTIMAIALLTIIVLWLS